MPNIIENRGLLMPDLGVGMLVTILREEKFVVSQIDLKPLFSGNNEAAKMQVRYNKVVHQTVRQKGPVDEEMYVFAEDLVKKYELKNFEVVGFSLDEETDLLFNLALIKIVKDLTGKIIILGGGFRFTKRFMEQFDFIDFLIKGDATISLKLFLSCLEGCGRLREIPGLSYRRGRQVFANPHLRQAGNVDMVPDFTDLSMDDYRLGLSDCSVPLERDELHKINKPKLKLAVLPYHFIKGCPNSCKYCYWNRENLFKVTSPEKVADNLQFMSEKYKISNFLFLNNAFNPTLKYAEKLIKAFSKRRLNIFWSDSANPGSMSTDMFSGLKETGCKQLYFGLESLSPRILKLLNRKGDPDTFSAILKASHDNDIFNGVNFIIGIPFEKFRDIKSTYDFIKQNKQYFEYYNVNLLKVIPEFGFSKDPAEAGMSLRKFGSVELRNPLNDSRIRKILNLVGISQRANFYSYDEIGGLSWEEKNRQDLKYSRYLSKIMDMPKHEFFEDLRFIFYLNHIFNSKKEILDWYNNLRKSGR